MSRPDHHDVEYSTSLNFLRNGSSEREGLSGYHNPSTYPTTDRRPSNSTMSSYSLYGTPGGARTDFGGGVKEWWDEQEPATNKHSQAHPGGQAYLGFNQHHQPQRPTPSLSANSLYGHSFNGGDYRDNQMHRQQMISPPSVALPTSNVAQGNPAQLARSTLWWGDLEAWMDEEYVKQACKVMNWDPLSIKVPHPPPDPSSGQQANNPGYCFLTFHSPAQAQAVLNQITNSPTPITMPNSAKPFSMNWASSAPSTTPAAPPTFSAPPAPLPQQEDTTPSSHTPQYTKEYSIFVGDLAPETSNSDLVAVFRNPVLGLRNDREPKFIRPFLSCKSAKIMLDPVTGVSRGYGFVRFTDESDQQRALIEMHGLYCLSRPMRISPATAKFKAPSNVNPGELPVQFSYSGNGTPPAHPPTKSISASIATANSVSSLNSNGSSAGHMGPSNSNGSMPSALGSSSSLATSFASASSEDVLNLPTSVLAQIAQQYANGDAHPPSKAPMPTASITSQFVHDGGAPHGRGSEHGPRYMLSEESWKHHAQARAILGNLIGPNGEQLTSTDPYNTTVFVGGLSPLINEDTLRTFFAPFGDIHYVKVPVGKHCGFVQFVRKADAERAIEKMQGFPVGGSRIRLSWGRSQYKAAQAAAQAAQTAALSGQYQSPAGPNAAPESNPFGNITPEQAYHILQKIAASHGNNSTAMENATAQLESMNNHGINPGLYADEDLRAAQLTSPDDIRPYEVYSPTALTTGRTKASPSPMGTQQQQQQSQQPQRSSQPGAVFSPFLAESGSYGRDQSSQGMGGPWKYYGSRDASEGASPVENETIKVSTRPTSAARYGPFLNGSPPSSQTGRTPVRMEAPISRPASDKPGHTGQGYDALRDLNGTLASLDLDRPWKSPTQSSESSAASVQFRLSVDHGSLP